MKLLIISSGVLPLPPVSGGAVENLIDILLQDNEINKKYDITVYSIFNNRAVEKSKNYKNCNFKFIDNSSKIYKLKKYIRGIVNKFPNLYIGNAYIKEIIKRENFEQYDYIVIENSPEYAIPISKITKKKLILHLHNDRLNKKTKNAKKIIKMYNKIFTLSNFIKERVSEITPLEKDKIYTLYNGVDINKFGKEKYIKSINEAKNKYGILKKDKILLYTGRIVPEKGVLELIKAFNKLKNHNDIKLLVAGSVNYKKEQESIYLKKVKREAANNKNIIFIGYIDYEKMPIIYAIANIGIVPSIWEEPFALTVVEHMATGNPVIITNSGGMTELVNNDSAIIINKNNNIINNLKDAIEKLIYDTPKMQFMGNMARKQSKKFDKKIYIKNFEKLIKENNEDG